MKYSILLDLLFHICVSICSIINTVLLFIIKSLIVPIMSLGFFLATLSSSIDMSLLIATATLIAAIVTLAVSVVMLSCSKKDGKRSQLERVKYTCFDSPNLRMALRKRQKKVWEDEPAINPGSTTIGGWTEDEIEKLEELELQGAYIESLKGLEVFSQLKKLIIKEIGVRRIELFGMSNLERIAILDGNLDTIIIKNCIKLKTIELSGCNSLERIRLEGNERLKTVSLVRNEGEIRHERFIYYEVSNPEVSASSVPDKFGWGHSVKQIIISKNSGELGEGLFVLDVRPFTELEWLDCSDSKLSALIGLSGRGKIKRVVCSRNNLTQLNVEHCHRLQELGCADNGCAMSISLSGCLALRRLWLFGSAVEGGEIDLSGCPILEKAWLQSCGLKCISGLYDELEYLNCSNNEQLELQVDGLPQRIQYLIATNGPRFRGSLKSSKFVGRVLRRCPEIRILEVDRGSISFNKKINNRFDFINYDKVTKLKRKKFERR